MTDSQPPKPHSKRIYVLWGVALALLLAGLLGWLYSAEIGGRVAGHMALWKGEPVLHYQRPWAPPALWDPAMKLQEEEYGFSYRPGFTCMDGSWGNRWYASKNRVVRAWIQERHGRDARDITRECLERVCLRDFGVSLEEYDPDREEALAAAQVLKKVLLEVREAARVAQSSQPPGRNAVLIKRLGGNRKAAQKLAVYLRAPDKSAPWKFRAVALLACCGKEGLEGLLSALDHRDAEVRAWAAWEFVWIRQPRHTIAPALVRRLWDEDGSVRHAAMRALRWVLPDEKIPNPKDIGPSGMLDGHRRPLLDRLAQDKDPSVRQAAADALKKIREEQSRITGERLLKSGFKKAPGLESYSATTSLAELGKRLHIDVRSLQPVPSRPDGDPLYIMTIREWTCRVRPVVKFDKDWQFTGDFDLRDENAPVTVRIYRQQDAPRRP